MPTNQEINSLQGTRLSEMPPWMSYASELEEKLPDALIDEIQKYSEKEHVSTSSQNEEALEQQREWSNEVAKQYRWLTIEEYEHIEPRIGRIMHSSVFISKLREECGLHCWYSEHPMPGRVTLIVDNSHGVLPPQIACWVQEGFMVEYSMMRFDEHDVPIDERRRGWRTVLLQMQLKGILTEEKVVKVFGPATGPVATRYNSLLCEFRNRKVEVI